MSDDTPLHPQHPGRGHATSVQRLESDTPEIGGFILFFPSGHHLPVAWKTTSHITPTKEAALQYTGAAEQKLEDMARSDNPKVREAAIADIKSTNWVSVCAAVQKMIIDFNHELSQRISAKMALELPPAWGSRSRSTH